MMYFRLFNVSIFIISYFYNFFEFQITILMAKLQASKRRREFLLGFSESPIDAMNLVLASHARDAQVWCSILQRVAWYFEEGGVVF